MGTSRSHNLPPPDPNWVSIVPASQETIDAMTDQLPPQPVHQPHPLQYTQPPVLIAAPANNPAVASLILGIFGFCLTAIPVFIGLFLGGIPDVLAIVFGIVGLVRAAKIGGRGQGHAIAGLVLGGLGFLSIFIGAGTIW